MITLIEFFYSLLEFDRDSLDSSKDDNESVNENMNNEDFIPVLNEEIKILFDRAAAGKSSIEGQICKFHGPLFIPFFCSKDLCHILFYLAKLIKKLEPGQLFCNI